MIKQLCECSPDETVGHPILGSYNNKQQQYFVTSQFSLNPLAPQVATLIEAGQDNL